MQSLSVLPQQRKHNNSRNFSIYIKLHTCNILTGYNNHIMTVILDPSHMHKLSFMLPASFVFYSFSLLFHVIYHCAQFLMLNVSLSRSLCVIVSLSIDIFCIAIRRTICLVSAKKRKTRLAVECFVT